MIWPGEEKAWNLLADLNPDDVQMRAQVTYRKDEFSYEMVCLGQHISVSQEKRNISAHSDIGNVIINEYGDYSRLSILNYLVTAKDISATHNLIRPSDLPGGDIFSRGSHMLPLDGLSDRFKNKRDQFMKKGTALGGTQADYGDMAIELMPFPRVPVSIILWSGDDEFPPKASLLFDSSCAFQMSTDILWSTAMLTVSMMLHTY